MNELRKYIDILNESQTLKVNSIKSLERMLAYTSVTGVDVRIYINEPNYDIVFPINFSIDGHLELFGIVNHISGDLTVNKNLSIHIQVDEIDCNMVVNGSMDVSEGMTKHITGSLFVKGSFYSADDYLETLPINTKVLGDFSSTHDSGIIFPEGINGLSIGKTLQLDENLPLPDNLTVGEKIFMYSYGPDDIIEMKELNPKFADQIISDPNL